MPEAAPLSPPSATRVPKYAELIDWIVEHPPDTPLSHMSQAFGLSPDWMRAILVSDAFKDELARRRQGETKGLQEALPLELGHVAVDSLRELRKRTKQDSGHAGKLPLDDVRENAKMALDALGMGKSAPVGAPAVTVMVSQHLLENARERYIERDGTGSQPITLEHQGGAADSAGDPQGITSGGQGALGSVRDSGAVPGGDDSRPETRHRGGDQV